MYLKNDSSPNAIYAILVNASDGSPITSGVTAYHIQGTTRTAGAGTLTHIANGRWAYVPTQAETNYDAFAIDFYHANAVGQGALVEVVTANQGLAVITADTSAIKQKTDAYLDATIASRAPANTALSNTVWTDDKAVFLDAAISSRLEASSYVAPDNASISAIKTQTDKLQFDSNNYVYAVGIGGGTADWTATEKAQIRHRLGIDGDREEPTSASSLVSGVWSYSSRSLTATVDVNMSQALPASPTDNTVGKALKQASAQLDASISSRLAAASYTAPDNTSIAAIKTTVDWTLDAAISTRLAANSYVPPDNTSIAAIKQQTDKLHFSGDDVKATLDGETVTVGTNQDKTGYTLTSEYDRAKSALSHGEYTAPDNESITAIKQQTDKIHFTGDPGYEFVLASATVDVDEQAIADAVAQELQGLVSVVVQPIVARALISAGDGGNIVIDRYEKLVASWQILNADLSGHDLRFIVYTSDATKVAEYSGSEITVFYQAPNSIVTVQGPDTKTPPPGKYLWKLTSQTIDRVLLRGRLTVLDAPDAA